MIYLIQNCGDIFCTKMNKLLFYTDFLSYRERGIAMTGLSYRAISYGPVPENWDRAYSQFDEIKQETRVIGNFEGNILTSLMTVDKSFLHRKSWIFWIQYVPDFMTCHHVTYQKLVTKKKHGLTATTNTTVYHFPMRLH